MLYISIVIVLDASNTTWSYCQSRSKKLPARLWISSSEWLIPNRRRVRMDVEESHRCIGNIGYLCVLYFSIVHNAGFSATQGRRTLNVRAPASPCYC